MLKKKNKFLEVTTVLRKVCGCVGDSGIATFMDRECLIFFCNGVTEVSILIILNTILVCLCVCVCVYMYACVCALGLCVYTYVYLCMCMFVS